MREIALHLLDIAENSVTAEASQIIIDVKEDLIADKLTLKVKDNGKGMDEAMLARVTDPFVTTRTTRKVGLGIPLFKAAAETCCGCLQITSAPGQGACLTATFQRSHIDRMPLGDLAGTMLTLVIGHPEVNWIFTYGVNDKTFTFDDRPIKEELDGLPLTEPDVLAFIRQLLQEGIENTRQGIAEY